MKILRQDVLNVLTFFDKFERPLTYREIVRMMPFGYRALESEIADVITALIREGKVIHDRRFFAPVDSGCYPYQEIYDARKKKSKILTVKWRRFLRAAKLFRFIPFVDFVLVAGSLALGTAREDSDFDVIIGARTGRIFTVRLFCMAILSLFGLRRGRKDKNKVARDKICLNHFVTPYRYLLKPPYHIQWHMLYAHLAPVYGERKAVQNFFCQNSVWMRYAWHGKQGYWEEKRACFTRSFFEFFLARKFGNIIEWAAKRWQVYRIKKHLAEETQYRPRVRWGDYELELHPDTEKFWRYSSTCKP